jgi:hypothetical protein
MSGAEAGSERDLYRVDIIQERVLHPDLHDAGKGSLGSLGSLGSVFEACPEPSSVLVCVL